MSTTSHAVKICPVCGFENNPASLFCADCGASLSQATTVDDSQETTVLAPAISGATETMVFQGAVSDRPRSTVSAPYHAEIDDADDERDGGDALAARPDPAPSPESIRGFVLGSVAMLLMLLIITFYIWSTVLPESQRDAVLHWFG